MTTNSITRIVPSGESVVLSIPTEFGVHRWFANTKFVSQRGVRQFTIAPVGQWQRIQTELLPNARKTTWQRRGHDVAVFEAADRSNSCLTFVGPYHEAITWFGGPAPDSSGLNNLLGAFEFMDSPAGAVLRPRFERYVQAFGTMVVGSGTDSLMMIRSANDGLSLLPEWAGRQLKNGELWRTTRALSPEQAEKVIGTPMQWRYILANPTCVIDVMLQPHGRRAEVPKVRAENLVDVFDRFRADWLTRKDQRS